MQARDFVEQGPSALPALVLTVATGVVLTIALYVYGYANQSPLLVVVSFALLVLIPSYAFGRLALRGKRERIPGALTLLARDPRPPVVYFRSFHHDATTGRAVTASASTTEEEQLALVMNEIGPFVAIGEPGEELPYLGAARLYVPDEHWRETANALLARAALAVLRISSTDSFWWEVQRSVEVLGPERLVFVVPDDEALYEAFRQRLEDLVRCELPPIEGWRGSRARLRGSLVAVIFFDGTWEPTVIPVHNHPVPLLRRQPRALVPVLKYALRPVYERVGAPWTLPGAARAIVLIVAAFCGLPSVLLFLVNLYDYLNAEYF